MVVIKWEKDNTCDYEFYDLYAYTNHSKKIIAYLYWFENRWIMVHQIPKLKIKRQYDNYSIEEVNNVLFKAILDIQSDLNKISHICNDYLDAIFDYITDYIQGIDYNEN